MKLPITAASRTCWILVIECFVFTKNVLSWQTELSSLESQIREAAKRYALCPKNDAKNTNMKNFVLLFFLLISVLTFVSCDSTIKLNEFTNENLPFELMLRDLKLEKLKIPVGSKKHKKIIRWLNKNHDGWESSFASYNLDISVSQKDFNLLYNPGSDGVVVNFIDHEKISRQYSKKIKKGELDFLGYPE